MTEKRSAEQKYKYLIFDADHTLLNYFSDERAAFAALYKELGLERTEELMARSRRVSEETWTEAGMYDVHDPRIQENYHKLYRSHVTDVFRKIFAEFGYSGEISPQTAGEKFLKYLESEGELFPYAEELLKKLSEKYAVCIATNGLSSIQGGRLKRLKKYVKRIYISEEVGAIKPLSVFFGRIVSDLGAEPGECLMIGDSLFSDVAGAKAAGMDACWFHARGETNDTPYTPDHEISALEELTEIL